MTHNCFKSQVEAPLPLFDALLLVKRAGVDSVLSYLRLPFYVIRYECIGV